MTQTPHDDSGRAQGTGARPGPAQPAGQATAATHGRSPQGAQPDDIDARLASRLSRIRHTVVVLSGKGGVGKSTVAVNLAVALAERGVQVGLLDIDLHGPSVPKMLHLEGQPIRSHDGAALPVEFTANLKVMSIGFFLPSQDQAVIWRGPRKFNMIKQFLSDVEWGELDYLVVDAPPGTGDEPLAIIELLGDVDGAVVVTTPQQLAITDVRKSINFCRELNCEVLGVIENMSSLVCPHCGKTIDLFGSHGGEALAREAGVAFLGAVPMDPAVAVAGDSGRPYLLSSSSLPVAEAFRAAIAPILALDAEPAEGATPSPGPGEASAGGPAESYQDSSN